MEHDILKVYFSEQEIQSKVRELGAAISRDYAGKNPLIVSVLKGSFIFIVPFQKELCNIFTHMCYPPFPLLLLFIPFSVTRFAKYYQ